MRKFLFAILAVVPAIALAQKAVTYQPKDVQVQAIMVQPVPDGGCEFDIAFIALGTNPGDPPINGGTRVKANNPASIAACQNAVRAAQRELLFKEFDGGKP